MSEKKTGVFSKKLRFEKKNKINMANHLHLLLHLGCYYYYRW